MDQYDSKFNELFETCKPVADWPIMMFAVVDKAGVTLATFTQRDYAFTYCRVYDPFCNNSSCKTHDGVTASKCNKGWHVKPFPVFKSRGARDWYKLLEECTGKMNDALDKLKDATGVINQFSDEKKELQKKLEIASMTIDALVQDLTDLEGNPQHLEEKRSDNKIAMAEFFDSFGV